MTDKGPRLPARGYMVVDLDLHPTVIAAALEEATKRASFIPVFLEVHGPDDLQREQSRLTQCRSKAMREIKAAVSEMVKLVDKRWTPDVFSFMRSAAGGPMQGAHKDYSTQDLARAAGLSEGCVPGSAIIALEPGTSLRVFKGCFEHQDDDKEAFVDIPPGFCLIFRGDLIHSGVGYATGNHRLHCYLTIGDRAWVPDIVENTLPKMYECKYCDFKDVSNGAVRSHRYVCLFNEKGTENRLKKAARDKECRLQKKAKHQG